MSETEIRFAVPEALDATVRETYFAGDSADSAINHTTYFDTPDQRLWKNGIECRIRKSGDKYKQTVKRSSDDGPAFLRDEFETSVDSGTPNLEHLQSALPAGLSSQVDTRRIAPVFETEVWRRKRVFVEEGGNAIEAVYDLGTMRAGNKARAIDEVEHELLEGNARGLTQRCLSFLKDYPCGLLTEGKAARGFALLTGDKPAPVHAPKLRISADMTVPEAVSLALHGAFNQVMANHAALIQTGHPESIHQMRVGFRRLRSTLSAFEPVLDLTGAQDLLRETADMFARLGDVRDSDVFLTETLDAIPLGTFNARSRDVLAREVGRFRERAYEDVVAYATGPGFARLTVRWYGWIESGTWLRDAAPVDRLLASRPVADFAVSRLAEIERKLVKRGRRAMKGTINDWHRARIAAKKMRYAGEPLMNVLAEHDTAGGRSARVKSLGKLQDELGHFNDMSNVGPFLERVGERVPKRAHATFAEAGAYCAGWSSALVSHAVRDLERRWAAFDTGATTGAS